MRPLTSSLEAGLVGLAVAPMLPTAALAYSYNESPSGDLSGQSLGALALGSNTATGCARESSHGGLTRADGTTCRDFNDAFST